MLRFAAAFCAGERRALRLRAGLRAVIKLAISSSLEVNNASVSNLISPARDHQLVAVKTYY